MAKSRKKTTAQQVMGVAAMAMPAPVRDAVTSRWGARLSLLIGAALVASGVVTLQWTDGKPKVQIDRERAREIEQRVEHRVEQFEEQRHDRERLTDRISDALGNKNR